MGVGGYTRIEVEPSGAALGAEILGVDLAEQLDDETVEQIKRAWFTHQVIVFRDQKITPAQQVAFADHFGELDVYPFIEPLPDQPEVIPIIKEKDTRINFGGGWHSDTSYLPRPSKATMLLAKEVPVQGGDTMFANMVAAYEALSPGMKAIIDDLKAVFTADKVHGSAGFYRQADHPMQMQKSEQDVNRRVEHPIVRTHPETGARALYVSLPHIERLKRMTTPESKPLLDYLATHATSPEFTYRLRWQVGSLVLWDNRCVQHYALNDYAGQRREMHRLTLKGEVPV